MDRLQDLLALSAVILTLVGVVAARALMTPRAWWFLATSFLTLSAGLAARFDPLTIVGLALIFWFGWEWLTFALRVRTVLRQLSVDRQIRDQRGPVQLLWADQFFEVQVTISLPGGGLPWLGALGLQSELPHLAVIDRVPFAVRRTDSDDPEGPRVEGPVRTGRPLQLHYTIRCGPVGTARFEGVRIQLADLQGFFSHTTFLNAPLLLRILPAVVEHDTQANNPKRSNQLPPPGQHRLRQPGSGSELLDLRDYLPGDPPRTIAWKVSARRDRLITKEFESEVPIRCTLFVDTSQSVRLPTTRGTPLQRLIEIAAAVLRCNSERRDLTGLCLFNEREATYIRPERNRAHVGRLLHTLTDAGNLAPATRQLEPERLLSLAYSFAEEVYPELLRPERNSMPFWVYWMAAFPGHWRRRVNLLQYLHRRKLDILKLAAIKVPLALLVVNILASLLVPPTERAMFLICSSLASLLFTVGVVGVVILTVLFSGRQRRLSAWRKRLSALLSVRHGLAPGGLEAMLEDDVLFVLHMQQFLAEHQVPYNLPLYDAQGRYLFAAPEKLPVLGKALLQAIGRGRDNELFVLLADLLELDEHLEPLLQAVRVALGRHHQVILICPWPGNLERPGAVVSCQLSVASQAGPSTSLPTTGNRQLTTAQTRRLLSQASQRSYLAAYQRVRRRFAALGVTVVCAAEEEGVPLILQRIDQLRGVRRRN